MAEMGRSQGGRNGARVDQQRLYERRRLQDRAGQAPREGDDDPATVGSSRSCLCAFNEVASFAHAVAPSKPRPSSRRITCKVRGDPDGEGLLSPYEILTLARCDARWFLRLAAAGGIGARAG